MKTLAAILIFASIGFSAPFCAVDKYGYTPMCYYYDMASCQQAAAKDGGFCTYNKETQQQSQPNPYPVAPQGKNGYQIAGEAMQKSGEQMQQSSAGQYSNDPNYGSKFLVGMLVSVAIIGGVFLVLSSASH